MTRIGRHLPTRPRLRIALLALLAAALLALGIQAGPLPQTAQATWSQRPTRDELRSQTGAAQTTDALSPFEHAINSVIGRRLNVPGAD